MPLSATILLVVAATGLLGLCGGLIMLAGQKKIGHGTMYAVSFAAGALLGVVFFDLLPEVLEDGLSLLPLVLLGIIVFFLIEKGILSYHCHHEACTVAPTKYLLILGDSFHNLLDGVAIAAAFLVSPAVGWVTALAVLLHELPQEIGDFGALLHLGMKRTQVIWANVGSAIAALVGAALVLSFQTVAEISLPLVALTAGGFLYIANADLIPSTHKDTAWSQTILHVIMLILGIAAMAVIGIVAHE